MKTLLCIGLMFLFVFRVAAQVQELQQLQLDLEKLAQFKLILSQMKQGYQTLENGYNSVRDAAKGNFDLHKNYLDGLLVVSPAVKQSPALKQIAMDQDAIGKTFQTAWSQYQSSGLFSANELTDLRNRYNDFIQKVNDDLDVLSQTTTSGKVRMSDAERLQLIGIVQSDISVQLAGVKALVNDHSRLMVLRMQQKRDNDAVKKLSGIK